MRRISDAGRVLGELEARVMDVLWRANGALTVRAVRSKVGRRWLAYTTVMTTLDRLHKKGFLLRDREGLAFVYRPALSQDELHRRVIEETVGALLYETPTLVLAAFVETAASVDEGNLLELERLILLRKRGRK